MRTVYPNFHLSGALAAVAICALAPALQAQPGTGQEIRVFVAEPRAEAQVTGLLRKLESQRFLLQVVEERLASSAARPASPQELAERRLLEQNREHLRRELDTLHAALIQTCGDTRAPAGYIGVTVESQGALTVGGADRSSTTLIEYPVVRAIVSGSPAERAGLSVNDVLVSINGIDLRGKDLPGFVTEPGRRLAVETRRGARIQQRVLTVAPRPSTFRNTCDLVSSEILPTMAPPEGMVMAIVDGVRTPVRVFAPSSSPTALRTARIGYTGDSLSSREVVGGTSVVFGFPPTTVIARDSARIAATRAATALVPTPGATFFATRAPVIAGTQLWLLDENARRGFSVESGMLVVSVDPASKAAAAGLQPGDVIVRAAGMLITDGSVIQQAIREARGRSISLEVAREGRTRRITLPW
jgi:C-terminal processing protease CtpA/Prc